MLKWLATVSLKIRELYKYKVVFYGTPEGTFSFLFLSCAHKLLTRFNNIITRLNDLLCRTHKLIISF